MIRIQKAIAATGMTSRRQAEQMIVDGRVAVNGQRVAQMGMLVDTSSDRIKVDGKILAFDSVPPKVYWMFHKRRKTLTSRVNQNDLKTIFDEPMLKKLTFEVAAAGRLDYLSEGLLVMSNDGQFLHKLTHPSYKMPRNYSVLVDRRLTKSQEQEFQKGIQLKDGKTLPAELSYAHKVRMGETEGYWYFVNVFEGRNRLVRRLFEHFESDVKRLIRYGMGPLRLPNDLKPGEYMQLDKDQIAELKEWTKAPFKK